MQCFCEIITSALTKCLTHRHGIPHSTAFDQGTHITGNEEWQWAQAHGLRWPYLFPKHTEAHGLVNDVMAILKLSFSTIYVEIPCRSRTIFSQRLNIL